VISGERLRKDKKERLRDRQRDRQRSDGVKDKDREGYKAE
jgi:hypothetical protein